MSLASQDSYVNLTTSLFALAGQLGVQSTFSTLTVSSLQGINAAIAEINCGFISTQTIEAQEGIISSISTNSIDLDGNYLTTAKGTGNAELLLNGIPIATTENISSLSDWALDPAISTVNMNNNNIIASSGYTGTGVVSTSTIIADQGLISSLVCVDISTATLTAGSAFLGNISISSINAPSITTSTLQANNASISSLTAKTAFISSLVCNDISTITLTAISTIHAISSISSTRITASEIIVSSLVSLSSIDILTANKIELSSDRINLLSEGLFVDVDSDAAIRISTISLETNGIFASTLQLNSLSGTQLNSLTNINITSATSTIIEGDDVAIVESRNGDIILRAANRVVQIEALLNAPNLNVDNIDLAGDPGGLGGIPTYISVTPPMSISSILNVSTINGAVYPPVTPAPPNLANWANYPAINTIRNNGTSPLNLLVDGGSNPLNSAYMEIKADNGSGGYIDIWARTGYLDTNGGRINIQADGGGSNFPYVGGTYGRIDITANGGNSGLGIGLGGLINITATTPGGVAASSAIKINAAGVNSYAGAIPNVGSLAGYNFIYGTGGVNICTGIPSIFPNIPGTTFLYGINGIVLYSDVYTTNIRPYFSGLVNPSDLLITGRTDNFGFGPYTAVVNVSTVGQISFSGERGPASITEIKSLQGVGAGLEILNLSSINGAPYVAGSSVPANLEVSTLTVNGSGYVSTPQLFVSSINGAEYIPGGTEPNLGLSTLTMNSAGYVSSPQIFTSSVKGGYGSFGVIDVSTITAYSSITRFEEASLVTVRGDTITNSGIIMRPAVSAPATSVGLWFQKTISGPTQVLRVQPVGGVNDVIAIQNYNSTFGASPSTLGALGVGKVYIEGGGGVGLITAENNGSTINIHNSLITSTATVSEIVGLSSINGVAYTGGGGTPTEISQSGGIVKVGTAGEVSISSLSTVTVTAPNDIDIVTNDGNFRLKSLKTSSNTFIDTIDAGDMRLFCSDGASLILNPVLGIAINANTVPGGDVAGIFIDANGLNLSFSTIGGVSVGGLNGISTINGAAYPPPAGSVPANLDVSTITVNPTGYVSTTYLNLDEFAHISTGSQRIYLNASGGVYITDLLNPGSLDVLNITSVSTINGASYPPPAGSVPENLEVSTLTVNPSGYISSTHIYASSINTFWLSTAVVETAGVLIYGLSTSIYGDGTNMNIQAAADGAVYIVQASENTDLGHLYASSITVSSINGIAPGAASIPADLEVSTLTAGLYVSTPYISMGGELSIAGDKGTTIVMVASQGVSITDGTSAGILSVSELTSVSSINGAEYPPPPTADLTVSTLTVNDAGYISTPQIIVSTINGFPFYPVRSAFTNTSIYSSLTTSTILLASTVINSDIPGYCLVQANASFQNLTNQDRQVGLYISVDGDTSPSTIATVYAGIGNTANCSISYRAAVSTGTLTLKAEAIDSSGEHVVNSLIDIWATTNLYGAS